MLYNSLTDEYLAFSSSEPLQNIQNIDKVGNRRWHHLYWVSDVADFNENDTHVFYEATIDIILHLLNDSSLRHEFKSFNIIVDVIKSIGLSNIWVLPVDDVDINLNYSKDIICIADIVDGYIYDFI